MICRPKSQEEIKYEKDIILKDFSLIASKSDGELITFRSCGRMFLYFLELYDKGIRHTDI